MSELDRLTISELQVPPKRHLSILLRIRLALNFSGNETSSRIIPFGVQEWDRAGYPANAVNNRRYTLITFLPLALANQFKMFFNIFFLAVAVSQFVPSLQVGYLFTYIAPLAFVVALSLAKDAFDDLQRFRRDRSANAEQYFKLLPDGAPLPIASSDIQVGDLLLIDQNKRIPADCILLHTTEKSGASFVRTDQLDGETDWKLRFPIKVTQDMTHEEIAALRMNLHCEELHKDIYKFVGAAETRGRPREGVSLENTLWSNCVLASGTVVAAVIHTGVDTRSSMNASKPSSKVGLIDRELNFFGMLCFSILVILSFLLVVQQGFQGSWFVMFVRFVILLSSIIPISMRVNQDVARMWYSIAIVRDKEIPGTIVRNSNIPEELGRLSYLFSDKTGTLTKNIMEFRTLQLGAQFVLQHRDTEDFLQALPVFFHGRRAQRPTAAGANPHAAPRGIVGYNSQQIKEIGTAMLSLALCHNVTPVREAPSEQQTAALLNATPRINSGPREALDSTALMNKQEDDDERQHADRNEHSANSNEGEKVEYQASSPDEVAMVKFADSLGVKLHDRTLKTLTLNISLGNGETMMIHYEIIKMFPFSSERKSMSILLRDVETDKYMFLMKGADVKMVTVLGRCDWLEESCLEMAHKGLRTLVFAQKSMTDIEVKAFLDAHQQASAVMGDSRNDAIENAMKMVEQNLDLVCITGVEDQLQDDVTLSLETLSMCGVKVWMLTGDKVETATCIGRSTQLISRQATTETLLCRTEADVLQTLYDLRQRYDPAVVGDFVQTRWALITDGTCLTLCLTPDIEQQFADVARMADSVIVARCSPTQKAAVVECIRKYSPPEIRSAAIGDGGNDVAMILAANVGFGVEGLEGKQASMAADFSITKFCHCLRLIMCHGRNSYRRTCHLCQFIMHRGIVYSVVQAVFSLMFAGSTMSVFNGFLLMGYATVFTMFPVFAIVLNEDQYETDINEFPQLYKELLKSRAMNMRSFLQWVWVSFFQGGVMMALSLQLFGDEMFQIVSIAFTSLLTTELVIVATVVNFRILWRQRRLQFWLFMLAEVFSVASFFLAVMVLPSTFDKKFFFSGAFFSRVGIICAASIGPIFVLWLIGKFILFRPQVAKLH